MHVGQNERGLEDPAPAGNIEADSARRHHAALEIGRRNSPYRKAVAPMDVRHGKGSFHDPGEVGHVHHLLQGAVVLRPFEKLTVGKNNTRDSHARLSVHGYLPGKVIDFSEPCAYGHKAPATETLLNVEYDLCGPVPVFFPSLEHMVGGCFYLHLHAVLLRVEPFPYPGSRNACIRYLIHLEIAESPPLGFNPKQYLGKPGHEERSEA